jgi:hypothetical protein
MAWDAIVADWNESISKRAIAEAVHLAGEALVTHATDFLLEPVPA